MPRLPARFAAVILCFAPLFFQRSWRHAEVLLIGAILAPGRRTVSSILRITGRSRERRFVNYHRILNRAAWSGRAAARVLLGLLLDAFVPAGPVLLARISHTTEGAAGRRAAACCCDICSTGHERGHFGRTFPAPSLDGVGAALWRLAVSGSYRLRPWLVAAGRARARTHAGMGRPRPWRSPHGARCA